MKRARATETRIHPASLLPALVAALIISSAGSSLRAAEAAWQFRRDIQPLLKEFCSDCHADGANKGGVSFDEFKSEAAMLENHELWLKALKNVRAENMKRRQQEQRSVLDFVLEDARGMNRRLNGRDRDKLDQYLTGLREIETSIQKAERFGAVRDPGIATPAGIPQDRAQHALLMLDMLALAFQTDSTRVATLMLGHDGDNRSLPEIGISEGHHDLSHHFQNEEKIQKLTEIDLWYATQFAKFLHKLEATKDADGQSILHNSMILYGSGNADGNRHTHSNLPLILAGGGGGALTPGRYVQHGAKPMCNLFLSLADKMGAQTLERHGDSTGRLESV